MRRPPLSIRLSLTLLCLVCLDISGEAVAQGDVKGSREHPLIPSRMPGFYISQYRHQDFDVHRFPTRPKPTAVEGRKTVISYRIKKAESKPSSLEVRRNYTNALTAAGGTLVLDTGKDVIVKLEKGGGETWIDTWVPNVASGIQYYTVTIVEKGEMRQVITADAMLDAIRKQGFVALDVRFDTNKADIKPESQPIVDQIVTLMKRSTDLRISVEGHTDDSGTPAGNKALSDARARSVAAAIESRGIDAARLSAVGWGQEKPLADNRTEEGRAKNRRVELVKK